MWVPFILSLFLHEILERNVEGFLTRKGYPRSAALNPFGSFFFPFMMYALCQTLIVAWTKPRYNAEIHWAKNVLLILMGSCFYLAIAGGLIMICSAYFLHNPKLDNDLMLSMIYQWVMTLIKINLIMAGLNVLPVYPFDGSRLVASWIMKRIPSFLFIFKLTGLLLSVTFLIMPWSRTWIDQTATHLMTYWLPPL